MVAVVTAFSRVAGPESQCIARALRRRDSEFIGRMVSRYHYRLLRYLVYWTSRREQAEDLVQETWLRVLERAGQYNGRLRFEPGCSPSHETWQSITCESNKRQRQGIGCAERTKRA